MGTELDFLVIGNCILDKAEQASNLKEKIISKNLKQISYTFNNKNYKY